MGSVYQAPLNCRRHKYLATCRQHQPLPVRREVRRRQIVGRFLHPFLPFLVEIGAQRDRYQPVSLRSQVVKMQIRTYLINDAAF